MTPVAEAEFIKKNYPHTIIGNTFNEGAYLMWVLYPENKIFYDARTFPYHQWSKDFFSFQEGRQVKPFLTKYNADIWCVGFYFQKLLIWFLASPDWQPVFAGKTAMVFAKKTDNDSAQHQPLLHSENFLAPKNISAALYIFTSLVNMQEWQKATQLLDHMKATFTCIGREEEIRVILGGYLEGAHAFHRKDYDTAIQFLTKSNGQIINCSRMLVLSLLHSAAEKWEKGDSEKAFNFTDRVWFYDPGNLFSLYNAGIIIWHDDDTLKKTVDQNGKPLAFPDWRELLQAFLEVAPQTPAYSKSISIAQKILAGNLSKEIRPQLLAPLQPEINADGPKPPPNARDKK
jgi:hypothetical protein